MLRRECLTWPTPRTRSQLTRSTARPRQRGTMGSMSAACRRCPAWTVSSRSRWYMVSILLNTAGIESLIMFWSYEKHVLWCTILCITSIIKWQNSVRVRILMLSLSLLLMGITVSLRYVVIMNCGQQSCSWNMLFLQQNLHYNTSSQNFIVIVMLYLYNIEVVL